jgi:Protein of unknown function (DUF3632)
MSSSVLLSEPDGQLSPSPSSILNRLFSDVISPTTAASTLASSAVESQNVGDAVWYIWEAIFAAAATKPEHYAPLIDMLQAMSAMPDVEPNATPSTDQQPTSTSTSTSNTQAPPESHWFSLLRFGALWRDKHDILESWRDGSLNGEKERLANDSAALPAGVQYVNFNAFSAKLVALRFEQVSKIWAFYACRDALERGGWEEQGEPALFRAPLLSPAEVYAIDVSAAAQWVLCAGAVLVEVNNSDIEEHWARGLAQRTELWKGEPGYSRGRWGLWSQRFRWVEEQEEWGEEVKVLAGKAAAEIDRLLKE